MLNEFKGIKKTARISQEGLNDIFYLINAGLIEKLVLNTHEYESIICYRITKEAKKQLNANKNKIASRFDDLLKCPKCNEYKSIKFIRNKKLSNKDIQVFLICHQCIKKEIDHKKIDEYIIDNLNKKNKYFELINFFEIENVAYSSQEYFLNVVKNGTR